MSWVRRAVEEGKHIAKDLNLNNQQWKDFYRCVEGRKVFLFGIGVAADEFLLNNEKIEVQGVIDNDRNKQGFYVRDFLPEAWENSDKDIPVCGPEVLVEYHPDEVVVLITSTNYYEIIAEQVREYGIKHYFVALIMEANRQLKDGCVMDKDENEHIRDEYIRRCCEKSINDKKVLFFSFGNYADHGKYITEKLLKKRSDLDIVWGVNNLNVQVPDGIRKVYTGNWKQYIFEMETAGIWIYNMVVPRYVIKRSGQIYIQTKHWASVTLKKFYLDASTVQDVSTNVDNWKYNSHIMDYIITGSYFDTESCRRGFEFQKEVIQAGSPRSDALFMEKECREKVYSFYHIPSSVHTVIYAPTYRFNKNSRSHQHESRAIELDFKKVKTALENRFGGEWYIILRLHPSVAKESNKIKKPDYVIDASAYEDSEELVSACEVMISDYSSIMFEPAFVKKPVFLFATDKEEYIDREYNLLIEYDTLPFSIAETNAELIKCVEDFDEGEYEKNVNYFMEKYGVSEDGKASERVAEFISELIDRQRKE